MEKIYIGCHSLQVARNSFGRILFNQINANFDKCNLPDDHFDSISFKTVDIKLKTIKSIPDLVLI